MAVQLVWVFELQIELQNIQSLYISSTASFLYHHLVSDAIVISNRESSDNIPVVEMHTASATSMDSETYTNADFKLDR